MKVQCRLLQRWLPGYHDGDLPARWQRRLEAHLQGCPDCRRELADLAKVAAAVKAAPLQDPGEAFWQEFSRELHLKLVRAAHTEPQDKRRWFQTPYLLGAPALAGLLLWLATYLTPLQPVLKPMLAQKPQPEMAQVAQVVTPEQFVYVAMQEEEETRPEEDLTSWDVEPVLAGLTEQERQKVLERLRARKKDGSCVTCDFSTLLG